jgi:hypothetical protein
VIRVDDNGWARRLEALGAAGLAKAERAGISKHVKMVRAVARGMADFNQGSISYRTRSRGGTYSGHVGIKDYKLRFYAAGVAYGGTVERHTRSGWNRGVEFGEPFMARTASATDPLFRRTLDDAVDDALRAAGV